MCCSEKELKLETKVVGRGGSLGVSEGLAHVEIVGEVSLKVLVDDLAPSESEVPGVLQVKLQPESAVTIELVDASP